LNAVRRLIDLTEADLAELVDARLEAFLDGEPKAANANDGALDRAGAAGFLAISLSKLDVLCRREVDPLPFYMCADSRRFLKEDLVAWLRRQSKGDRV